MFRASTLIAASLAISIAAIPAIAHDPKPTQGGRIAVAGDYHVELVTKGTSVEAYLLDHNDKPIASPGHKGLAILTVEGKSERVNLTADDRNRLKGTSTVPLPANAKGVVQITNPGGKTSNARFN